MGGVIKRSFMHSPAIERLLKIKIFNTLRIVKVNGKRTPLHSDFDRGQNEVIEVFRISVDNI